MENGGLGKSAHDLWAGHNENGSVVWDGICRWEREGKEIVNVDFVHRFVSYQIQHDALREVLRLIDLLSLSPYVVRFHMGFDLSYGRICSLNLFYKIHSTLFLFKYDVYTCCNFTMSCFSLTFSAFRHCSWALEIPNYIDSESENLGISAQERRGSVDKLASSLHTIICGTTNDRGTLAIFGPFKQSYHVNSNVPSTFLVLVPQNKVSISKPSRCCHS